MRLIALKVMLFCAVSGDATAQHPDRKQPVDIGAESSDFSLAGDGESTLTGNVVITQGTLEVKADRAVVVRRGGNLISFTFTGKPASLQQVRVTGEPMTAKASRILYRMDSEVVTLTGDVIIEDPSGTLRGQTVNYDMRSGRLSGGNDGGRVRMRLLPKRSDD